MTHVYSHCFLTGRYDTCLFPLNLTCFCHINVVMIDLHLKEETLSDLCGVRPLQLNVNICVNIIFLRTPDRSHQRHMFIPIVFLAGRYDTCLFPLGF
jgi:hypothetical protein